MLDLELVRMLNQQANEISSAGQPDAWGNTMREAADHIEKQRKYAMFLENKLASNET